MNLKLSFSEFHILNNVWMYARKYKQEVFEK